MIEIENIVQESTVPFSTIKNVPGTIFTNDAWNIGGNIWYFMVVVTDQGVTKIMNLSTGLAQNPILFRMDQQAGDDSFPVRIIHDLYIQRGGFL